MGYRRRNYYSSSRNRGMAYSLRSEAWHMDGGSNDEGWHYRWCNICAKETEHGRQVGGPFCVTCADRK